jgi:hypothetical protein
MGTRGEAWPSFGVVSILLFLLTAGCASSATRMYSGSAKPRGEVARLDAGLFDVTQVDGATLKEGARFLELLPGCHSIRVVLDWREGRQVPPGSHGGMTVYGHLEQRLTFDARAGELYLVDLEIESLEGPESDQNTWQARVVRSRFLLDDQEASACHESREESGAPRISAAPMRGFQGTCRDFGDPIG